MKKKARRSRGSGSVFKKNGVFYYQWQAPDGKRHQKRIVDASGCSITARAEAEKCARSLAEEVQTSHRISSRIEYLHEIAEARNLLPSNRVHISGMWEDFLKSPRRPDSSSGTLDFYHDAVLPFQKWMAERHCEIVEVRDVTEEIAGEYAMEFWKSGISERTYNARITSLKMIFRVLLKDSTPFDLIRRKTPRPQSRNAFTAAQLKAISDTIDNPDYYMLHKPEMRLMLLIMLYTGCRGEDAALMKWNHIDFENRTITYIPIKTARKRPVPVTVPIAVCLYDALCRKEHDDEIYVLPRVADRYRRNPCGISTDITKLLEASGIKTKAVDPELRRKRPIVLYSMHSFRHTFCSIAVNAGIPLATVQAIVGHSTSEMTAHYTHISLESKQRAVTALELAAPSSATSKENTLTRVISTLSPTKLSALAAYLEEVLTRRQKEGLLSRLG